MDYTVDFPELRSAGEQFTGMQDTAETLVFEVRAVPLVQSDFGRIPWLQTRVWEAYAEHTTDCTGALEELFETLGAIQEGLDASADAYQSFEDAAEQACHDFFEQVG